MSATMRREIRCQPGLVAEILPKLRQAVAGLDVSADRIWAGGCGDGAFAAGAASALLAETGADYRPATAHELAFHAPVQEGDLVILASISGSTRRTVQAARKAQSVGADTLALTCSPDSMLAAACEKTLVLPFQPLSRRTPHTADYLATLVALAALAERRRQRRDETLDILPAVLRATFANADLLAENLVRSFNPRAKLFVLGQGSNLHTARYVAAKFHESGGLVALAAETENFVHGVNFMAEREDLFCVIGGDGPGAFRALELLPGLTRLCDQVVLIGNTPTTVAAVERLEYPAVRPAMTVFPTAVAGQVLCLAAAEALGLAVEEPRAGRAAGALHAEVQREWMTRTCDALAGTRDREAALSATGSGGRSAG